MRRRWLIGLPLSLTVGLWLGCSGKSTTQQQACAPGLSIACTSQAGCSGAQVCAADGNGYGPCVCPPGPGEGDGGASPADASGVSSTDATAGSGDAAPGDGSTIHGDAESDAASDGATVPCSGADGTSCDDGDACTQVDTCHGGVCVGANALTFGGVWTDGTAQKATVTQTGSAVSGVWTTNAKPGFSGTVSGAGGVCAATVAFPNDGTYVGKLVAAGCTIDWSNNTQWSKGLPCP